MEKAEQDYSAALKDYDEAQTDHRYASDYLGGALNFRNGINRNDKKYYSDKTDYERVTTKNIMKARPFKGEWGTKSKKIVRKVFDEQKFNQDVAKAEQSIHSAQQQLEQATQNLTNTKNHLINTTDYFAKELYANKQYTDSAQKHMEAYVLSSNENHKASSINATGMESLQNKQFDMARSFFKESIETATDKDLTNIYQDNIAISFKAQGLDLKSRDDYDNALEFIDKAVNATSNPSLISGFKQDKAQTLYQQGNALLGQNKFLDAAATYMHSLHLNKDVSLDLQVKENVAQAFNAEGCQLYEKGNYSEAVEFFRRAENYVVDKSTQSLIQKNKMKADISAFAGECLKQMGAAILMEGARALVGPTLGQIGDIGGDLLGWLKYEVKDRWANSKVKNSIMAGIKILECKQYGDALKQFSETLILLRSYQREELNERFISDVHLLKASVYEMWGDDCYQKGRYIDAMQKYQEAANLSKKLDKSCTVYQAKYLISDSLSELSKEEPHYETALMNLNAAYQIKFAESEGYKEWQKLILNQIREVHDILGEKALEEGKYEEAVEHFEVSKDKVKLLCAQGCQLEYKGEYKEALKCFDTIFSLEHKLEDNPNLAKIINEHIVSSSYQLGHKLVLNGNLSGALENFKKAQEMEPENLEYALKVSYVAGHLGLQKGDAQEASIVI